MVPFRDIVVARLSTEVGEEFMSKHEFSFQDYLRLRGLGYKTRSKLQGSTNLWNLSTRLRFYIVMYQHSRRHFLDWISMKSLTQNLDVHRAQIEEILYQLYIDRVDLIRRLRSERMCKKYPTNYWQLRSSGEIYSSEELEKLIPSGVFDQPSDSTPVDYNVNEKEKRFSATLGFLDPKSALAKLFKREMEFKNP